MSKQTTTATTAQVEEVKEVQENNASTSNEVDYSPKAVIARMLKAGAKEVKGLTVKNVHIAVQPEYVRVSLTLDKPVDGYVMDEDGEYQLSKTNVIFVSHMSLATVLRNNPKLAFLGNKIMEMPQAMEVLLSYAKIDIVQEHVSQDDEYSSPWSGKLQGVVAHDSVYNHVTNITLSDDNMELILPLKMKYLGL